MSAHLDEQHIADLRELMADDFGSLVEAFLRDSTDRMQQLNQSFAAGDLVMVKRQAHSLKGSSSNLGAQQLADHCQQLEALALTGDATTLVNAFNAVSVELSGLQQELRGRFS